MMQRVRRSWRSRDSIVRSHSFTCFVGV